MSSDQKGTTFHWTILIDCDVVYVVISSKCLLMESIYISRTHSPSESPVGVINNRPSSKPRRCTLDESELWRERGILTRQYSRSGSSSSQLFWSLAGLHFAFNVNSFLLGMTCQKLLVSMSESNEIIINSQSHSTTLSP